MTGAQFFRASDIKYAGSEKYVMKMERILDKVFKDDKS
jgi:hypothetical protein